VFKKRKGTILAVLLLAVVLALSACSSGVPQADYNRLLDELSQVQDQLVQAQQALASQNATLATMVTAQQYQDLSGRYTALENSFQMLQGEQQKLQQDYEGLKQQYDAITSANISTSISTGDVEQMLFNMINQERVQRGIKELAWGRNLYVEATTNDQNMASSKTLKGSSYSSWQAYWWATGYQSSEDMANATMTVWKNQALYEPNFFNVVAAYGAVAVYQSGDIYYITFIASQFQ